MGIRTPDLLIANETLYQLSYTPQRSASKIPHRKACGKRETVALRQSLHGRLLPLRWGTCKNRVMTIQTLIVALLAALVVSPARAEVLMLSPSRDNTLFESSDGATSNGQGPFFYVGRTGSNDADRLRRGLIAFDLTTVPTDVVITDVTLTLYLSQARPSAIATPISLTALTRDWGEGASNAGSPGGMGAPAAVGDATWLANFFSSNLWATPGGDFAAEVSATTAVNLVETSYSWSGPALVDDVQRWLASPSENFGWIIRGDEVNPNSAKRFNSSENSLNPPVLTVTYTAVPEPAGVASFGLAALVLVIALTRRRRV